MGFRNEKKVYMKVQPVFSDERQQKRGMVEGFKGFNFVTKAGAQFKRFLRRAKTPKPSINIEAGSGTATADSLEPSSNP